MWAYRLENSLYYWFSITVNASSQKKWNLNKVKAFMVLDLHKHSAFWSNDFSTWKPKNGAFGEDVLEKDVWCVFGGEKLDTAESHNLPIKNVKI